MDYLLKDIIKIDSRFERSINLSLDLNDPKKLDSYIPTRSSIAIIASYLENTLTNTGRRASILIGPYGKGKSHLLLVLLGLLSSKNNKEIKTLARRILKVSPEYKELFKEAMHKRFLPVVINAGEGSLSRAFYKGLVSALKANELTAIVPDSYYTEAIKAIRTWNVSFPDAYEAFVNEVDDSDLFIKRLERFDAVALAEFIVLYPKLTSGSMFNPLVEDDVIKVYRSVNKQLSNLGYSGIYIIFDEFSKYIEGHDPKTISEDMKVLQDFCELCSGSKDEQFHLTLVAHKSIKSYGNKLDRDVINAFEGVSGRLTEIQFIVSSKNNYELISDAIRKTTAFTTVKESTPFKEIKEKSFELKPFSSAFVEADFDTIVAEGCYPLTPLSAMLLIELCEGVAQNERTIFTFLAGNDAYCLSSRLKEPAKFVGLDLYYDYFARAFTEDLGDIRHEWLKAEYALEKADGDLAKSVIKAIAIIHMVGRGSVSANAQYIALSLGISAEEVKDALDALEANNLITFKKRSLAYEFKNNIGTDVESALIDCEHKYFDRADITEVLNDINQTKFIMPKKHNQDNCITRYFDVVIMSDEQFMALSDPSYIQVDNTPDGFLLLVLPKSGTKDAVYNHICELRAQNIMVIYPNSASDVSALAKRVLAIRKLRGTEEFIENNLAITKELDALEEDLGFEINSWIHSTFLKQKNFITGMGEQNVGQYGINRAISDMCDSCYTLTPVINNELINRHNISAQISKARNVIIDGMLKDADFSKYSQGTSAEATIYRAVFSRNESSDAIMSLKKDLQNFFMSAIGQKQCFEKIISTLVKPPYGMRKGVLPLIILDGILNLNGTPVVYFKEKEVVLDKESIQNCVALPKDYYFYLETKDAAKDEYLKQLEELFIDYSNYCKDVEKKNKLNRISCLIQSWYRSQPQISKLFTKPDYDGQDVDKLIAFRSLFANLYLNPREVLFESIPVIMDSNDLRKVYERVVVTKNDIESHIHIIKRDIATTMRRAFGFAFDANLKKSLEDWYAKVPSMIKNSVFDGSADHFIKCFEMDLPSDEEKLCDIFVKAVTGTFIEDWKDSSLNEFENELKNVIVLIETKDVKKTSSHRISFTIDDSEQKDCFIDYDADNLSVSGTFLRNALNDVLDEYDGVTENNEKIGILLDLIKERLS